MARERKKEMNKGSLDSEKKMHLLTDQGYSKHSQLFLEIYSIISA